MTKFKVVTKKRQSCGMALSRMTDIEKFFYKKDSTVEAIPGSIGILVFDNRFQAELFIKLHEPENMDKFMIILVKPIETGKKIDYVLMRSGFSLYNLTIGLANCLK